MAPEEARMAPPDSNLAFGIRTDVIWQCLPHRIDKIQKSYAQRLTDIADHVSTILLGYPYTMLAKIGGRRVKYVDH